MIIDIFLITGGSFLIGMHFKSIELGVGIWAIAAALYHL